MTGNAVRWTEQQLAAHKRRREGAPKAGALTTCRLILPWPPSVNTSGADSQRGGRKTDEYHAFVREVGERVAGDGCPHIDGRLQVCIEAVPPDARARDLDNVQKALLDALAKAGVYDNDSQIDDLRIRRYPCNVPGEGSACVTITRMVGTQ